MAFSIIPCKSPPRVKYETLIYGIQRRAAVASRDELLHPSLKKMDNREYEQLGALQEMKKFEEYINLIEKDIQYVQHSKKLTCSPIFSPLSFFLRLHLEQSHSQPYAACTNSSNSLYAAHAACNNKRKHESSHKDVCGAYKFNIFATKLAEGELYQEPLSPNSKDSPPPSP